MSFSCTGQNKYINKLKYFSYVEFTVTIKYSSSLAVISTLSDGCQHLDYYFNNSLWLCSM